MADVKVTRARKAARDAFDDIDYLHKLGPEESAFMERFLRATGANCMESIAELTEGEPAKRAALQKQIFNEDDARRRDIMFAGTQVDLGEDGDLDGDAAIGLGDVSSQDLPNLRCVRCLRAADICRCPAERQRHPRYGQADYLPPERTEDALLNEIDLARRMEAFDLLPYGEGPKDLRQGHTVKICLPHHLLKDAWGYVLDFRPMTGEFLVRSMSKPGLRDKDGTLPIATVCWVKPAGLKRWAPKIIGGTAKVSAKRVDKN